MSYIMAEKLVKKYGNGEATVTAVSDISFKIESGEFVGVMGESGAGKSTIGAAIMICVYGSGGVMIAARTRETMAKCPRYFEKERTSISPIRVSPIIMIGSWKTTPMASERLDRKVK